MLFLPPNTFHKSADYARTEHFVETSGASLEDLARPAFWTHVASRLRANDRIEVLDKAGAFDVDLRVVEVGIWGARMRPLRIWHDAAVSATEQEDVGREEDVGGFLIKFAGKAKWRVIRKVDSQIVADGIQTKDEATKWVEAHKDAA
jgi:hypothetical protein